MYGRAVLIWYMTHIHRLGNVIWGAVSVLDINVNCQYIPGATQTPAAMVDGCDVANMTCYCTLCKFICSYSCVTVLYHSQKFRTEPTHITIIFIVLL